MSLFAQDIHSQMEKAGVVAGFSVNRVEDAVPIARALLAGGINVIELTLRTEAALEAVGAICREVPEMIVGVGTILTIEQLDEVVRLGAHYGVAPGLNAEIVKQAEERGFSFAPGVVTPSDIELAVSLGCRFVKFFPAEAVGGLQYLKSMAAPYRHLGMTYFPLGGITSENMVDYLAENDVPVVGGSWIVKNDLVATGKFDEITARAQAVRDRVDSFRAQQ